MTGWIFTVRRITPGDLKYIRSTETLLREVYIWHILKYLIYFGNGGLKSVYLWHNCGRKSEGKSDLGQGYFLSTRIPNGLHYRCILMGHMLYASLMFADRLVTEVDLVIRRISCESKSLTPRCMSSCYLNSNLDNHQGFFSYECNARKKQVSKSH